MRSCPQVNFKQILLFAFEKFTWGYHISKPEYKWNLSAASLSGHMKIIVQCIDCIHDEANARILGVRPKIKLILFPASQPTLSFSPDPKVFIDIRKNSLDLAFLNHYKLSISRLKWGKKLYLYQINWLPMTSWVINILILCKTTVRSHYWTMCPPKKKKDKLKNKIFFRSTYPNFFAKEAGNRTIFCFGLNLDFFFPGMFLLRIYMKMRSS